MVSEFVLNRRRSNHKNRLRVIMTMFGLCKHWDVLKQKGAFGDLEAWIYCKHVREYNVESNWIYGLSKLSCRKSAKLAGCIVLNEI